MPMNRAQFQPGLSMPEFIQQSGTEAQCDAAMEQARWPQGFQCPRCGHAARHVFRVKAHKTFRCNACRRQTSLIAGTLFQCTKLPLTLWFLAILLVSQAKTGWSALVLKGHLGVSYPTAWLIQHKPLQAMAEREARYTLVGQVQVDDAYLGDELSVGKAGRDLENKAPFVAAVTTGPRSEPWIRRLVDAPCKADYPLPSAVSAISQGFMNNTLRVCLILVLVIFQLGCAIPARRAAVPKGETSQAIIPGIPNARYWLELDMEAFVRDAMASLKREKEFLARSGRQGEEMPPANFLAISGGGDDGAFGAGLLVGWSATGTRPEFKGVTGISTGALIAPFAFLGPDYDDELKVVYTNSSPKDIFSPRSLLAAVTNDGMADNKPLLRLIDRTVNKEMLEKIAKEYRQKGRLLLMATTDLDARRAVIWNMGEIAASADKKRSLDLFHRIMLASAAIPGIFPPVMIDVEVNGKPYQEMHVDGGAMAQVFLYPPWLNIRDHDRQNAFHRQRTVFIIRNARLDPDWSSVERRTMTIAQRAISSLIHTQGIGDLYRIYLTTQRDGFNYHLGYIGEDFKAEHKEDFDTQYLRALFDYGYRQAMKGYPWKKTPPGYSVK